MALVHQQAGKLDAQTQVSGEQSVTIEKQFKMIEQLREENRVRINRRIFDEQ